MLKNKITLLLFGIMLIKTMTSKILVFDSEDLPKVLKALGTSGSLSNIRKTLENGSPSPVVCVSFGKELPGIDIDGEIFYMTNTGLKPCPFHTAYDVESEVSVDDNLWNCQGIDYTYRSKGELKAATKFIVKLKNGPGNDVAAPLGFYLSGQKVGFVLIDGKMKRYRKSMGKLFALCKKQSMMSFNFDDFR